MFVSDYQPLLKIWVNLHFFRLQILKTDRSSPRMWSFSGTPDLEAEATSVLRKWETTINVDRGLEHGGRGFGCSARSEEHTSELQSQRELSFATSVRRQISQ